jgi:hypothetical protein
MHLRPHISETSTSLTFSSQNVVFEPKTFLKWKTFELVLQYLNLKKSPRGMKYNILCKNFDKKKL